MTRPPPPPPPPPFAQVAAAEPDANSGDVILAKDTASLAAVAERSVMNKLPSGHYKLLGFARETGGPVEPEEEPPPPVELEGLTPMARARLTHLLRTHVVDNVRQRIEAGHQDFVNELRICTVVFLGVPSLLEPASQSAVAAGSPVGHMQAVMRAVQRRLAVSEGSLLQFRMDEKGFIMIGAFGLPGKTHEDDAVRGLRAALAITQALKELGACGRIGVTTGQLFCACVGAAARAEYSVFGDTVNLAARLMVKSTPGDVWCDASTWSMARRRFRFVELEPMKLKGKAALTQAFRVSPPTLLQQRQKGEALLRQKGGQHPAMRSGLHLPTRSGPGGGSSRVGLSGGGWSDAEGIDGADAGAAGDEPLFGRDQQLEDLMHATHRCVSIHAGGLLLVNGEVNTPRSMLYPLRGYLFPHVVSTPHLTSCAAPPAPVCAYTDTSLGLHSPHRPPASASIPSIPCGR